MQIAVPISSRISSAPPRSHISVSLHSEGDITVPSSCGDRQSPSCLLGQAAQDSAGKASPPLPGSFALAVLLAVINESPLDGECRRIRGVVRELSSSLTSGVLHHEGVRKMHHFIPIRQRREQVMTRRALLFRRRCKIGGECELMITICSTMLPLQMTGFLGVPSPFIHRVISRRALIRASRCMQCWASEYHAM